MWTLSRAALRSARIDFGAVVNCTQAGDIIRIRTEGAIRLATRVIIPWNLTLTAFSEETDSEIGDVPRAIKATFKCPKKEGAILIRRETSIRFIVIGLFIC